MVEEGREAKHVLVNRWRTCEFSAHTGLTWAPMQHACFKNAAREMHDKMINSSTISATKTVLKS
jgi:hypothetical protein